MRKAVGLFSNDSTPGRGKAEYGGLSLQSARQGYSTVIYLCVLRKKKTLKPHIKQPFSRSLSMSRRIPVRVKRRSRPWLYSGVRGNKHVSAVPPPPPPANLLFLNSLHVFLLPSHPLLRWQGDVGLPSTGWECHVKRMPHKYEHPNLWNRKCL